MNPKTFENRIAPHPEFLQRLLEDPTIPEMTYCQLFVSMLLAQWQGSNSFATNHPPSFILVTRVRSRTPACKCHGQLLNTISPSDDRNQCLQISIQTLRPSDPLTKLRLRSKECFFE